MGGVGSVMGGRGLVVRLGWLDLAVRLGLRFDWDSGLIGAAGFAGLIRGSIAGWLGLVV